MLRVPVSEPDIVVDRLCPSPGVGFGLCKSIGDRKDNGGSRSCHKPCRTRKNQLFESISGLFAKDLQNSAHSDWIWTAIHTLMMRDPHLRPALSIFGSL